MIEMKIVLLVEDRDVVVVAAAVRVVVDEAIDVSAFPLAAVPKLTAALPVESVVIPPHVHDVNVDDVTLIP
jgi:hypothetical protein